MEVTLFRTNIDGDILGIITPASYTLTEETNVPTELDVESYEPIEHGDRLVWKRPGGFDLELIVTVLETAKEGGQTLYKAKAIEAYVELQGDYIEQKEPNGSPAHVLGEILSGTRWGVLDAVTKPSTPFHFFRVSVYEALQKLVEGFGVEIRSRITTKDNKITGRYLELVSPEGQNLGRRFEWNRNLLSVSRLVDSRPIYTALIGYGKGEELEDSNSATGYGKRIHFADLNGGKRYVEDTEALKKYGLPDGKGGKRHRFGVVIFEDEEDKTNLKKRTEEALKEANHPQVSYTANVIDLSQYGDDWERVQLGEIVNVIDEDFGRLEARMIRRVQSSDSPDEITLGNFIDRYAQEQERIRQATDLVQASSPIWDSARLLAGGSVPASYITGMIDAWNDELNKSGGVLKMLPGGGLLTEGPSGALQIVSGGLRIANRKTSSGEWIWETIATGRGFLAQKMFADQINGTQISAGTITGAQIAANSITADKLVSREISANEIKAGRLSSKDGRSYFDLNSGEVVASTGRFTGSVTGSNITGSSYSAGGGSGKYSFDSSGGCSTERMDAKYLTAMYANFMFSGIFAGCQLGGHVGMANPPGKITERGIRITGTDGKTIIFENDGNVWLGIYSGNPDYGSPIWGISRQGGVVGASDRRLKKDITRLDREQALQLIKDLSIWQFRYEHEKAEDRRHIGVIAQLLNNHSDLGRELVHEIGGTLCVDYQGLSNIALSVVGDLIKRVEALEERSTKDGSTANQC